MGTSLLGFLHTLHKPSFSLALSLVLSITSNDIWLSHDYLDNSCIYRFIVIGMDSKQKIVPRGIRNNNPLNIRIGNVWLGEVAVNSDGVFEQFISMQYGIRAAFILLRRYIRHYKLTTIEEIISRWAPEVENKLKAYIDVVCQRTGLPADAPLSYEDQPTMCALLAAMAYVECGTVLDEKKIIEGYKMA